MRLSVIDIGLTKKDIQTREVTFNGTLEEYKEHLIKEFNTYKDARLVNISLINNRSTILVEYYDFKKKKPIMSYLTPITSVTPEKH